MSARRRTLLLSAAFLAFAAVLAGTKPAGAQPPGMPLIPGLGRGPAPQQGPGQQDAWSWSLTPEQFRAALDAARAGIPPELAPLVEQLREQMKKDQPQFPPQLVDAALKELLKDPNFLKQLKEAAERQKGTGKAPTLPPDFAEKLKGLQGGGPPTPGGPGDPAAKIPPLLDGKTPPKVDPGTVKGPGPGTAPVVPTTPPDGKGPQPMPGTNPGPGTQPAVPPAPPAGGNPLDQPRTDDPFSDPLEKPEDAAKRKAMQALSASWERNVGPLDETPAVRRALEDLVAGAADMKDPDGRNFWESLLKENGEGGSFGDLFDGSSGGGWKLPSFELPSLGWGRSGSSPGGGGDSSSGSSWWNRRPSAPRTGSSGINFGSGVNINLPGLEGSWPALVLLAVLVAGFLAWRFWYQRDARPEAPFDLGGLGAWPVDPRRIATREDLVRAFEYLSVLICGESARMWTHNTIAEALAGLAATHAETAVMLARLYELARYAPLDEPLTADEIAEARRLVCRLAGVSSE